MCRSNFIKIYIILSLSLLRDSVLFSQTLGWVDNFGGIGQIDSYSSDLDQNGNVYTTGSLIGTVVHDQNSITTTLSSSGSNDIYISKSAANGNLIWAKNTGGTNSELAYSINIDLEGSVYVTGIFSGTSDFDPGPTEYLLTSAGNFDVFILKLDTNGNFVWALNFGGTDPDIGRSISSDDAGNIYVTGYYSGSSDFDPGPGSFVYTTSILPNVFVSKFNTNGEFIWAKSMGGNDVDEAYSISVDAQNNVLTTGNFIGSADFDPGTNIFNLNSVGSADVFISKLDSAGNFIWAKNIGSTSLESGRSIATDLSSNVLISGYFQQTTDFDPGSGSYPLSPVSGSDNFVLKLSPSGNFKWAKQISATYGGSDHSMSVDTYGNIYNTGNFQGTIYFDTDAGLTSLSSNGNRDIFLSKLDSLGNFEWAKNFGGSGEDFGLSVVVDDPNAIYGSGTFSGTADFDPTAGTSNLTASGSYDIYILRLNLESSGLMETTNSIGLELFPNPSYYSVVLRSNYSYSNSVLITIYSSDGKVKKRCDYNLGEELILPEKAGIYFLEVQTNSGNQHFRVSKISHP